MSRTPNRVFVMSCFFPHLHPAHSPSSKQVQSLRSTVCLHIKTRDGKAEQAKEEKNLTSNSMS